MGTLSRALSCVAFGALVARSSYTIVQQGVFGLESKGQECKRLALPSVSLDFSRPIALAVLRISL